jgi:hypothetical protein
VWDESRGHIRASTCSFCHGTGEVENNLTAEEEQFVAEQEELAEKQNNPTPKMPERDFVEAMRKVVKVEGIDLSERELGIIAEVVQHTVQVTVDEVLKTHIPKDLAVDKAKVRELVRVSRKLANRLCALKESGDVVVEELEGLINDLFPEGVESEVKDE